MLKKNTNKTIEQTDYELKASGKFPADESYPDTENSKQKNTKKVNRSKFIGVKFYKKIDESKKRE